MQEAGAKTGQMALGVAEAVSEEISVFNEGGGEASLTRCLTLAVALP